MEREVRYAQLRFANGGFPVPEHLVIIRSHSHWGYGLWQVRGATAVSMPAMKMQDDFAKTLTSPNRYTCDNMGMVGIEVYDELVDGSRVKVKPYLFDHPDEEDVDVFD
jgi:hypothetical protein